MASAWPDRKPIEYAFGDESGQVGFRFTRGSTECFIFSLLLTSDWMLFGETPERAWSSASVSEAQTGVMAYRLWIWSEEQFTVG